MGLWDKLFGRKKNNADFEASSPYLPEEKNDVEIVFAEKFTQKGGKFIYSEDVKSTDKFFKLILEENHWSPQDILCFDAKLTQRFGLKTLANHFNPHDFKVLLIGCEYLIANKGTVLICHHQLKDYKLESFTPIPLQRLPFPSILVCSSNDHWASVEISAFFAKAWGSKLVTLKNAGHINPDTGYTQ